MAVTLTVNEKTRIVTLTIPIPADLKSCPNSSSGKTKLLASVNERIPAIDAMGFFGTRLNLNLMSYPKAK